MNIQTENLLKEWNASAGEYLNFNCLGNNSRMVDEVVGKEVYSRIHRKSNDVLILEERKIGSMYPVFRLIKQDFSELENALAKKISQQN